MHYCNKTWEGGVVPCMHVDLVSVKFLNYSLGCASWQRHWWSECKLRLFLIFWFNSLLCSSLLTAQQRNHVFFTRQLIISSWNIFRPCNTQNTKILITFQSPITLGFTPCFSLNSHCCKESVSVRRFVEHLYKSGIIWQPFISLINDYQRELLRICKFQCLGITVYLTLSD